MTTTLKTVAEEFEALKPADRCDCGSGTVWGVDCSGAQAFGRAFILTESGTKPLMFCAKHLGIALERGLRTQALEVEDLRETINVKPSSSANA